MTEKEEIFLQSALKASGNKDGNFSFSCPHCSEFSFGTRKSYFNLLKATCVTCNIHITKNINKINEKGA